MSIAILPDTAAPGISHTSLFTSPAFREVMAHAFRLEAIQLALTLDEQTVQVPAFRRNRHFGKPTLILGAGFDRTSALPELSPLQYSQMVSHLLAGLHEAGMGRLEIRTPCQLPGQCDTSDKVELNIDLNPSADAVWNGISTHTRKQVRRTLKQGFTFTTGNTPELLQAFHDLYRMSLHAIGSLPHPWQFFSNLLRQCSEHIDIFVGYLDNRPVVASLNFTSQDEIYGAWSGIHPDYRKHNVFLAMLWQMVEHCAATGRHTYNLGRSSRNSNPYHFKRKLANREHPIHYYRFQPCNRPSALSPVHQAASWLIRHTPPVVMDGLSRSLLHRFY